VTALGPREVPRRLPPDAERILMVITFDVNEGDRVAWHDVWSRVRQYALEWPACSAFRLGRSHHTRGPMVVMATWDNHEELNRFVRQSNILWIDRALDYHAHYAVFEMIPAERSTYQMEPQLAAAKRGLVSERRPPLPVVAGVVSGSGVSTRQLLRHLDGDGRRRSVGTNSVGGGDGELVRAARCGGTLQISTAGK
jgi:hypothetical protein